LPFPLAIQDKGTVARHASFNTERAAVTMHTRPAVKKKKKNAFTSPLTTGPTKAPQSAGTSCRRKKCRFTFFIVGEHVLPVWGSGKPGTASRCHQYRVVQSQLHACVAQSLRVVLQQPDSVVAISNVAATACNLATTICRTPGRNAWRVDTLQYTDLKKSRAAIDSLQQAGFTIIGWTLNGNMHTMISVS